MSSAPKLDASAVGACSTAARRSRAVAAAAWDAARERRVPEDLDARLADGREGVADATRNHGAVMLERLASSMPYLIGGSADSEGPGHDR